MRTLGFALPVLALLCASCAGLIVPVDYPDEPVLVEDEHPGRGRAHLGIPPGHLPPPGQCRIWVPGRPPGHQPRPGPCARLQSELPAGAWLVYRPENDRDHVKIKVCHEIRPAVVVSIRTYEVASGRFIREEKP